MTRLSFYKDSTITAIYKFNNRISHLKQNVSKAIARLSIATGNYKAAIDILKDRFRIKQMIINKRVEGLLNMADVTFNQDV